MSEAAQTGLVRIVFRLEPNAWHGSVTERLWAQPVGTRRYRLRNSPFFAFGVSAEDVVFADEREGELWFAGVSLHGGHSTYRIKVTGAAHDRFEQYWRPLQQLGCSYEEGVVLAVDVPPKTDIHAAYAALEAGELAGVWDFEEGHCGHPPETVTEDST
ncbi:MAG: hypothetical protein JWM53_3074 [bacterium]|nr:hypothetical protein [bacterium]